MSSFPQLEDLPSSPYYLHSNENPSLVLVSSVLTSLNYHSWSRAMGMALQSKNKVHYVYGSLPSPTHDDPLFSTWECCNTMVLSWLLRAVSPSIALSVLWLDTAHDVWFDLKDRFSQGYSFRVAELQEENFQFRQGTRNVTDYFTSLKILWGEFLTHALPDVLV